MLLSILPKEMVVAILTKLEGIFLVDLVAVSKSFKDLITGDTQLAKKLTEGRQQLAAKRIVAEAPNSSYIHLAHHLKSATLHSPTEIKGFAQECSKAKTRAYINSRLESNSPSTRRSFNCLQDEKKSTAQVTNVQKKLLYGLSPKQLKELEEDMDKQYSSHLTQLR